MQVLTELTTYHRLGSLWAGCLIVLFLTSSGSGGLPTLSAMWVSGFGSVHASSATNVSPSFLGNVLVANSPQLLASATYFLYNQIITSMVLTSECNDFAIHRKALRVSKPVGRQRSTYYLQLPYRYAVPLMVISCLLHWLISQSFFFVNLTIFGINGEPHPERNVLACGWSPIAIVFTLIVGGVMLIGIFILGFRKYSLEMQIMRSNSLKISAACHPPNGFEGAALQPVEYGIVDIDGEPGRWRACFTSMRNVQPLSTKVPKRAPG